MPPGRLRPTEVLIFGKAKAGPPLMQSVQTSGLDLPLKALVWQDISGGTWLSYNDPAWLSKWNGRRRDGRGDRHHDRRTSCDGNSCNDVGVVLWRSVIRRFEAAPRRIKPGN